MKGRVFSFNWLCPVLILILTLSWFLSSSAFASPTEIYVPDDYPTIQAAVDAAISGDEIIVRDGTYTENVDVNKDHLTIKSENGAETTIVQAATPEDDVFHVEADHVSITGFMIKGVYGTHSGIRLYNANYSNISENICENNVGIFFEYSDNNTVSKNTCSNNSYSGIFLEDSHNNVISKNTCSNNEWHGIVLADSDNNTVLNNICSNNAQHGIVLGHSLNNTVSKNTCSNNEYGIDLWYSNNNTIYLNNFMNNIGNVHLAYSTNIWNSAEKITYTYNGTTYTNYPGNHWSDYTGSDAGGDGIGDTPYSIDGDQDGYPLMEPFENYVGEEEPNIDFPDPNLEQAIRDAINKPTGDIYPSNLEGLTKLDASDRGITDLTGIEYCKDLKRLNLISNSISDIHPVASLTSLSELILTRNNITDISPLSNLISLRRLWLARNNIISINPLRRLTNLEGLYLGWNGIMDLNSLTNLTSLKALHLSHNNISNISPLSGLTNLEWLHLGHNNISNISPLNELTNLKCLELDNNNISNISPLRGLANLEWLYLGNNNITDIQPLVDNGGWGDGDYIDIRYNYLNLTPGSDDIQNIQTLIGRGVTVEYEPQKTTTGTVTGKVTDSSTGSGIPGARVEAEAVGSYSTTTDANGNYTLSLPEGTYDVTASVEGYESQTRIGITVTAGETTEVNFALTPTTDTTPPALIQNFTASDGEDGQSTLRWTNPPDSDLAEVIVRRKTVGYPDDHTDGDMVYRNTSPTPGAQVEYVDTSLTNGQTYYYAVFSKDLAGNWNDKVQEGKNTDTGTPTPILTPGTTRFTDAVGRDVAKYVIGATVYVTVNDPDENRIAGAADVIDDVLMVENTRTHASVTVDLTETGPDTGVFLSEPMTTGALGSGAMFEVEPGDTLKATYTDPDDPADVSTDDVAIESLENQRPNPPSQLSQFKSDGQTQIGVGETITESSVIFKGMISDPNGDRVRLQVELRRLDEFGGGFDETQGGLKESDLVTSGSEAMISVSGLISGCYHWRARAVDEHGLQSDWVSFGNNPISEADFTVADTTPPALIQDFSASDGENGQSTLRWTNPPDSDLAQVIVKRKMTGYSTSHTDGETRLTIDAATPGGAETYVDEGLTNGQTYYYTVFSKDSTGNWNDNWEEGKNADTGTPKLSVLLVHGFQLNGCFNPNKIWKEMIKNLTGVEIEFIDTGLETSNCGTIKIVKETDKVARIGQEDPQGVSMIRVEGNLFVVYTSNYSKDTGQPTFRDIRDYAKNLAKEIQLIKNIEDVNKVDIVAHSMGGLVARSYIEVDDLKYLKDGYDYEDLTYEEDVEKLIMLGTPNNGAPFPGLDGHCSILQMGEESSFLIALNASNVVNFETEYSAIAGNYCDLFKNSCRFAPTFPVLISEGDGLVRVKSVLNLNEIPESRRFIYPAKHSELRTWRVPALKVKNILRGESQAYIGDFEFLHLCSPGELRVYNHHGQVTGLVNGEVKEEIPNSNYDEENKSITFLYPSDDYRYEVVGMDEGTYGLDVASIENGEATTFTATDIPTTTGAVHNYTADWDALSEGEEGVAVQIDSDGDGTFERGINTGNTLSGIEMGSNIKVEFPDQGATLIFDTVTAAGITGLIITSEPPFDGPYTVDFIPAFYIFETTATYTGNITIIVNYDDTGLTPDQESTLKLFKVSKNAEVEVKDITTDLDTEANLITGQTDSFSFFAVGYQPVPKMVIARYVKDCPRNVENPDKVICRKEIEFAAWLYLNGQEVPETGGEKIDLKSLREMVSFYITKTPIDQPPPGTSSQKVEAQLESLIREAQGAGDLRVAEVLALLNPVGSTGRVEFRAKGVGIKSIEVEIFDLSGRRVFDSGEVMGSTFEWHLLNTNGRVVANGIYLYIVTVKGFDREIIRSRVKKLVVLR